MCKPIWMPQLYEVQIGFAYGRSGLRLGLGRASRGAYRGS